MELHSVLIKPLILLIIYRNIPGYVKNKADWHLVHVFCGDIRREFSAPATQFRCTVSCQTEHSPTCNTDVSCATPRDPLDALDAVDQAASYMRHQRETQELIARGSSATAVPIFIGPTATVCTVVRKLYGPGQTKETGNRNETPISVNLSA